MKSVDISEEEFRTIDRIIAELTAMRKQITDLKASETAGRLMMETLRTSEKRYREVFENLPQRIFVKNKNLAYVFCNEHYARDLNIRPEEIAGKIDYDFHPEDLASKYIADEERILSSEKGEEIEDKYVTSGQELTIRAVKIPLKDEKGEITGILGIFWDITESKRSVEESEKQRARLAELVSEHTARIQSLGDQLQKTLNERQGLEEESQRIRALLEGQVTERGAELERVKGDLEKEAGARQRAEEELQKTWETLESKLSERGAELERVTAELQREATERRRLEEESGRIQASLAGQLEERTSELQRTKAELEREILERTRIEEELQGDRESLQDQLSQRSAEVEKLNGDLLREMRERQQAVDDLQQSLQQFRAIMDSVQQIQAKLGNDQPHQKDLQTGT